MTGTDPLLEALDEPAFLLTLAGAVAQVNRAGLRLVGRPAEAVVGRSLAELLADDPGTVADLLRRSAGSAQVTLGAVRLRDGGDAPPRKLRWRACRVAGAPLVLLRLAPADAGRFTALTEKIVALNAELARNRRIQVELRRTVGEREMLLGELNHRVKNNIQTLLGILLLAERRLTDSAAIEALRDMRLRLEAIGVVQRLLYRQAGAEGIDGRSFLESLCAGIERGLGRPGIAVEVAGDGAIVDREIASALGLIVNELVTNAFKHAFAAGEGGTVRVALTGGDRPGGPLVLTVEDNGRGLGQGSLSGTGIDLLNGLARQLDAGLTMESRDGLRCAVTLGREVRAPVGREQP
jgi:two-component sensor histidine kinase